MTRRRALAAIGLATVAAALLAAPLAVGAQESPSASAGWWSRSPAQSAPQDGFAVASAPDGPVTVAAVVVAGLSGSITSGTVRAVEVSGLGQQDAAIVVCPAAAPVSLPGEEGGDLADAPEADCERGSAPFERDAESMQWSADLSGLADELGGDVALVIVPAPTDAPVQPTFEVRLAAPEVDLVVAASDPAPDRSGPTPSPGPAFETPPEREPVTFDRVLSPGSPTPAPPPRVDVVDPVDEPDAQPAAEVPEPVDDDVSEEETAMPVRPTAGISSGHGPQFGKALSYVALSALAGAAVTGAGRLRSRRQLRA